MTERNNCHLKPGFTIGQLASKHKVSELEVSKQLEKGKRVEMEHTTDPDVAHQIASQHIEERLDYYDKTEEQAVDRLVSSLLG